MDVLRPGVMSCAPDAPLVTVAQIMATHHVHSLVVGGMTRDDAGGEHLVWGLVSDMDIVRAAGREWTSGPPPTRRAPSSSRSTRQCR